jgi:hypothetical protein
MRVPVQRGYLLVGPVRDEHTKALARRFPRPVKVDVRPLRPGFEGPQLRRRANRRAGFARLWRQALEVDK